MLFQNHRSPKSTVFFQGKYDDLPHEEYRLLFRSHSLPQNQTLTFPPCRKSVPGYFYIWKYLHLHCNHVYNKLRWQSGISIRLSCHDPSLHGHPAEIQTVYCHLPELPDLPTKGKSEASESGCKAVHGFQYRPCPDKA